MCGRFETKKIEQQIIEQFRLLQLPLIMDDELYARSNFDIRPTEKILSISYDNSNYHLGRINWGFRFKEGSPFIFNSRIETIKEKPYWKNLFDKYRCIVPMTGFYEWKTEGKKKIKYRVSLPDKDIFYVPALYYTDKEKNRFASLITTTPNKYISTIHHRMPVILDFPNAVDFLIADIETNLNRSLPYDDNKKMEIEAC
ncbi:hypothetical protein APF79_10415 [bacterium BRH_c32]|nr:MAG: hypothetical protein APF79_10415 [bacterium BRH_c32]